MSLLSLMRVNSIKYSDLTTNLVCLRVNTFLAPKNVNSKKFTSLHSIYETLVIAMLFDMCFRAGHLLVVDLKMESIIFKHVSTACKIIL